MPSPTITRQGNYLVIQKVIGEDLYQKEFWVPREMVAMKRTDTSIILSGCGQSIELSPYELRFENEDLLNFKNGNDMNDPTAVEDLQVLEAEALDTLENLIWTKVTEA